MRRQTATHEQEVETQEVSVNEVDKDATVGDADSMREIGVDATRKG